jgi:hypothetical protein
VQPVSRVVCWFGEEGVEQALDLVAGQGDKQRFLRGCVFGAFGRSHDGE